MEPSKPEVFLFQVSLKNGEGHVIIQLPSEMVKKMGRRTFNGYMIDLETRSRKLLKELKISIPDITFVPVDVGSPAGGRIYG